MMGAMPAPTCLRSIATAALACLILLGCGDGAALDGGAAPMDAGSGPADSGATSDAGGTVSDAGEVMPDAGLATSDAGPVGSDAGPATGGVPPVLPSAGCGATGAPTGRQPDQVSVVGGVDRGYDLFVPEPYDPDRAHAVVFNYHGVGGTANTNQFRFDTFSEDRGGVSIQVAPQGWGTAEWAESHFVPFNLDESVTLFDQVVERLAATYCIDLNRIYAMGHSNGGQMAFHLGCLRGDRLRAVMPSGGRCFSFGPGLCDPDNPPSAQRCTGEVMVLSVMGEDDTSRHADEAATVEGFRSRQGCDATTEARDPAPCQRFTGCEPNGEVAACRIPGLGHGIWRDGRPLLYDYMMSL